jgi:hypothetical protein
MLLKKVIFIFIYLGSIRTPESVRTKIVRILQSYKTAKDYITNTGSGLTGISFSNYQDKVVSKYCRYYFILDPVLGQRPNVKPWFTNEDGDKNNNENDQSDYDEESDGTNNEILCIDIDKEIEELTDMGNTTCTTSISSPKKRSQIINLTSSDDSTTLEEPYDIRTVQMTASNVFRDNDTSARTNINTSISKSSSETDTSMNTTVSRKSSRTNVRKKVKITPSAAMNMQKSLLRNKKMQINAKSNHSKMSEVLSNEEKEREFLMQVRNSKLQLERERHDDLKSIEMKKIMMEEKRLKIASDEGNLKAEQIKVQTLLEKNKALLVKMEIFKTRQAIKKADPSITDEFLDKEFPYSS